MVVEVNDNNFAEIKQTNLPILLDLGATWCGPCKALAPIVEEVAADFEGKAVIGKADVDECPELAAMFRVRSVPTVLFIKGGEHSGRQAERTALILTLR